MNIQARKQALRQSIIAAREKLPAAERMRSSGAILEAVRDLPAYRQAETVLGYLSFGAELETDSWVRQALSDGKRMLLPRVERTTRQLEIYQIQDLEKDVAPGSWGIREPLPECCIKEGTPGAIDLILLPGVAFTRAGARLGYGGGFYDKLLARMPQRTTLVAGAFAMQVVPELPQEETDRTVGWLVTENETICCN